MTINDRYILKYFLTPLTAICFFISNASCQSKWALTGVVKELHYNNIFHSVRPIESANISVSVNNTLQCNTTSRSDGIFYCATGIKPATSSIEIHYLTGYELVDSSTRINLNWNDGNVGSIQVFLLCRKDALKKLSGELAEKVRVILQKEYQDQLDQLKARYTEDQKEQLTRELRALNSRFELKYRLSDSLSYVFSRLDSSGINATIFKAYEFYFKGRFDSTLYYLNPRVLLDLGVKAKLELDQAVFLSLLRADLCADRYIHSVRHYKDSADLMEATRFYRYANELKDYNDLYSLEKFTRFLIYQEDYGQAIPLLKRSLYLIALTTGSLDDSVRVYGDLSYIYENLREKCGSDSIPEYLYNTVTAITGLHKRILETGNVKSQSLLYETYRSFPVRYPSKTDPALVITVHKKMIAVLKSLEKIGAKQHDEPRPGNPSMERYHPEIDVGSEIPDTYENIAMQYIMLHKEDSTVRYLRLKNNFYSAYFSQPHTEDEYLGKLGHLEMSSLYISPYIPKQIRSAIFNGSIVFLKTLKKKKLSGDAIEDINDTIELMRSLIISPIKIEDISPKKKK